MYKRIGFGLFQSCGNMWSVGRVSVFGLRWCGCCMWEVGSALGLEGWCYVSVSLDPLCRWQVQVSADYARRIAAHIWCTQSSILLHLIDICSLTCICLWKISQIQTCLCVVVGLGFVSTAPAFMRSSAIHPASSTKI